MKVNRKAKNKRKKSVEIKNSFLGKFHKQKKHICFRTDFVFRNEPPNKSIEKHYVLAEKSEKDLLVRQKKQIETVRFPACFFVTHLKESL